MKRETYVLKFESKRLLILEKVNWHSVCSKTCEGHRGEVMSCQALKVSAWCVACIGGSYVLHGRIFIDDYFSTVVLVDGGYLP